MCCKNRIETKYNVLSVNTSDDERNKELNARIKYISYNVQTAIKLLKTIG